MNQTTNLLTLMERWFSKPGDIFKFKPIEKDEFKEIELAVDKDEFEPLIKQVEFNLDDFLKDIDGYNRNLIKELYANWKFWKGLAVSIQDLGRIGFYRYGIPMGGAMDRESLKIANLLVGNEETAACFEAPFLGPKLRFKDHRQIAVTGGEVSVKVDSTEFRSWESITVEAGSVVEFGFIESGARLYISVSGGLNVPIVLNSRSTYTVGALGGFKGRMLQAGDLIPLTEAPIQVKEKNRRLPSDFVRNIDDNTDIRVLPGLYWHRLTQESGESFFKDTWTVATEAG